MERIAGAMIEQSYLLGSEGRGAMTAGIWTAEQRQHT